MLQDYFILLCVFRSQEFSELGQESSNYRPPAESLKSSKHPKIDEPLKTLDVFAGCGGLSAGLESSGVAQGTFILIFKPLAIFSAQNSCEISAYQLKKIVG